jgi:hypothetical protein
MPFIQLQFRRDTAANWAVLNTILATGEMGIESDTEFFKVGDGIRPWNSIPYGGIRGPTGATGAGGGVVVGITGPTGGLNSTITQSLIPNIGSSYDLGSLDFPFRSGYFSPNSLFIGNTKISTDANGNLTVKVGSANATPIVGGGGGGTTGVTGATGATGATGSAGAIAWQGLYNAARVYSLNDGVLYNGNSYVLAAFSGTSNTIPTNQTFWASIGANGATGPAGSTGATGQAGALGPTGATGVAGTAGATGATGVAGQAGALGPTGATGVAGQAGQAGAAGATGATGVAGQAGQAGAVGPTGATGVAGQAGQAGPTGQVGPTGATGVAGQAGATGVTGTFAMNQSISTLRINTTNESAYGLNVTGSSYISQSAIINGFVGIGCNTPLYPLDVNGYTPLSANLTGWQIIPTNSSSNSNGTTSYAVSIHASDTIWTSQYFFASSDERIKKNIIDASSSLDIISSIQLRSFEYKDPADTRRTRHGVIAQEVRAVYPEAVSQQTDIIHNILQQATSITPYTDGSLLLEVGCAHELSVNDSVCLSLKPDVDVSGALRLDASGNPTFAGLKFETPVLEVNSETMFTVASWPYYTINPTKEVMVVGKRVDDFLSVDKDVLGLLALGGVKELLSKVTSLTTTLSSVVGLNPGLVVPASNAMASSHMR